MADEKFELPVHFDNKLFFTGRENDIRSLLPALEHAQEGDIVGLIRSYHLCGDEFIAGPINAVVRREVAHDGRPIFREVLYKSLPDDIKAEVAVISKTVETEDILRASSTIQSYAEALIQRGSPDEYELFITADAFLLVYFEFDLWMQVQSEIRQAEVNRCMTILAPQPTTSHQAIAMIPALEALAQLANDILATSAISAAENPLYISDSVKRSVGRPAA